MKYSPTEEQQLVVDTMKSDLNGQIVLVEAHAGCTKTSSSLLVVAELKPKKGLYYAFNKKIVEEAKDKFPTNIECRTLHSLALSYIKPKKGIEDLTYTCIEEDLPYQVKASILNAIDNFFRSNSTDMEDYLTELLGKELLVNIAMKYINLMIEDKIPVTFNFLLKYLHLLLDQGLIELNYDLVILDEIQDTTEVALEIFKLINSSKKLGLGETHQAIYRFMDLANGFEELSNVKLLHLTRSFRCSTEIANKVQNFMRTHLDSNFHFVGFDREPTYNTMAYITLTNAKIVERIAELHKEGKGYTLTRPIKDIFACPLALITAASGKEVYHKKYRFLEKEFRNYTMSGYPTFYTYLMDNVEDEEIKNTIKLLNNFRTKKINIWDVLKEAKKHKAGKSITVGTAFSLKGTEFDTVYIEDDLNTAVNKIITKGGAEDMEDVTILRVAYVGISRSKHQLINCKFA